MEFEEHVDCVAVFAYLKEDSVGAFDVHQKTVGMLVNGKKDIGRCAG